MNTLRSRRILNIAITLLVLALALADTCMPQTVADMFGRNVTQRGITLVDWEGQIANPAPLFFLNGPPAARYPVSAELGANDARLYFDNPSDVGPTGPTKRLTIAAPADRMPFRIAIFPDRDGNSESYTLNIRLSDADGRLTRVAIPVTVIDQDRARPTLFPIVLDYSMDRSGFFDIPVHRAVARQAADDWAYFFDDMTLDPVPKGTESTWVWSRNGFHEGGSVRNACEYRGMLLYLYGFHDPASPRSGGDASYEGRYQSSYYGLAQLPVRCSGAVGIETDGNYNSLGWRASIADDDWWMARNLRGDQCDLYSIMRHEIGHSLVFHSSHARTAQARQRGAYDDPAIRAYIGRDPPIDATDHLVGVTDRMSAKGPFGREYYGDVPARRWLITKLDLLCAQAVGYRLRATSAFEPLSVRVGVAPRAVVGRPFHITPAVRGGTPAYCWDLTRGVLPPTLTLDTFTGAIRGTPTAPGTYRVSLRVRDSDEWSRPVECTLTIQVYRRTAKPTPGRSPKPGL